MWRFRSIQVAPLGHDTVGAVALDSRGSLAAATSTGGITGKRVGRVGDSPLIGNTQLLSRLPFTERHRSNQQFLTYLDGQMHF